MYPDKCLLVQISTRTDVYQDKCLPRLMSNQTNILRHMFTRTSHAGKMLEHRENLQIMIRLIFLVISLGNVGIVQLD